MKYINGQSLYCLRKQIFEETQKNYFFIAKYIYLEGMMILKIIQSVNPNKI